MDKILVCHNNTDQMSVTVPHSFCSWPWKMTNRGCYPYTCWAQLTPSEKQGEVLLRVIGTCLEWHILQTTGLSVTADVCTDKNPPFCYFLFPKHFYSPTFSRKHCYRLCILVFCWWYFLSVPNASATC